MKKEHTCRRGGSHVVGAHTVGEPAPTARPSPRRATTPAGAQSLGDSAPTARPDVNTETQEPNHADQP